MLAIKRCELRDAESGGEEKFKNGAIAEIPKG